MKYKKLLHLAPILIILSFFIFSQTSFAQGGIIPAPTGGRSEGDYTLTDIMSTGILVSDLILGLVGSLSLLMFVIGGVTFMVSAGSSDKISKAKNMIVAAVVGLLIVFASHLIIKFTLSSIDSKEKFDGVIKTSLETTQNNYALNSYQL